MEPLISIIVPVYNVEQYLPKCLDSILTQTYRNLQIILVDDGSKDNSGLICDQYSQRDSRICVIHQENAGIGAVRNRGIAQADAEYIMFVDSDDYLTADSVKALYERMVKDNSDLVVGKHADVEPDGTIQETCCEWTEGTILSGRQVLENMNSRKRIAVVSWGKLYKKSLFEDIKYPDLACGEDCWVFPLLIDKCSRVSKTDQLVYYYFRRQTSIMRVYNAAAARDNLEANLHLAQYLWNEEITSSAKKWFRESVYRAYNVVDEADARALLRKYFDRKTTVKLLLRQTPKTCLIWLAVYLPFIKRVVQWLKEKGIKK